MPSELFGPSINVRRGYSPADNRHKSSHLNIPYLFRNGSPTYLALGLAGMAGILMGIGLLAFNQYPGNEYQKPHTWSPGHVPSDKQVAAVPKDSPFAPIPQPITNHERELLAMISRTDGYWARDYSLNLGWNNVRVNH